MPFLNLSSGPLPDWIRNTVLDGQPVDGSGNVSGFCVVAYLDLCSCGIDKN